METLQEEIEDMKNIVKEDILGQDKNDEEIKRVNDRIKERRIEMDRAMACCNALQDELQYIGECLYADLNKYTNLVLEIQKEFNMIKSLRQSDNRFLKDLK